MSNRYRTLLVLILLAMASFASLPPSVSAAIWYVSTTGANVGAGTESNPWRDIQYAISTSSTVSGDTVVVENGTYNENISLVSKSLLITSRHLFSGMSGDIDNTVIAGVSGSTVSIATSATLHGLTIRGGNAVNGGGIYVTSATPVLEYLVVVDNVASGSGGGVYLYASDAELTGTTVVNNSATYGGGVFAEMSGPVLSVTTVKNNTADYGGGVYVRGGEAAINTSWINENVAWADGGGLYADSALLSLAGVTLNSNNADDGGGIYQYHGDITGTGVYINYNSASQHGGGVYLDSAHPSFSDLYLQHNQAGLKGGGLYAIALAADFSSLYASYNTAGSSGGGVYVDSMTGSITYAEIAYNTAGGSGGGWYAVNSQIGLQYSYVTDNTSGNKGGGIYTEYSDLRMVGGTVARNVADHDGGGIALYFSTPYFYNANIHTNTATTGKGGGVYQREYSGSDSLPAAFDGAEPGIISTTISSNDAGGNGGGYCFEGLSFGPPSRDMPATASEPTVELFLAVQNSSISSNSANGHGGGLYGENVVLSVENTTVSGNTASNGGGGLALMYSHIALLNSSVNTNSAGVSGGGLYASSTDVYSDGTTYWSNNALGSGGGVYHYGMYQSDAPTMPVADMPTVFNNRRPGYIGADVYGNTAESDGGGLYLEEVELSIAGSSVSYNSSGVTADYGGGGLYVAYSQILLDSTSVENNHASNRGGGILANEATIFSSSATISYNDAFGSGGGVYWTSMVPIVPELPTSALPSPMFDNRSPGFYEASIEGNEASDDGGGLYLQSVMIGVVNSSLSYNSCGNQGGGIYTDVSHLVLASAGLYENRAGYEGGGLYSTYSNIYATTATVFYNHAYSGNGGGVYHNADISAPGMPTSEGTPFVLPAVFDGRQMGYFDMDIQYNTSGGHGGGMAILQDDVLLAHSNVSFNSCDNYGGALYISGNTHDDLAVQCIDVRMEENVAQSGGGIAVVDGATPLLSGLTVQENSVSVYGGGLFIHGSVPSVSNSEIVSNRSGQTGGGIWMTHSEGAQLSALTIQDNSSGGHGGGLYCSDGILTADNLIIQGNAGAGYGGGGIFLEYSRAVFSNLVLSGNRANVTYWTSCVGGGGMFAQNCSTITLKNATVTGNRAVDMYDAAAGGGILLNFAPLHAMNSIIWNNYALNQPDIGRCTSGVARVYNSVVNAATINEGTGNINCDPQFVSPVSPFFTPTTSGELQLSEYSPAIGAGVTSATVTGASVTLLMPTQDILGVTRASLPDMGAYEYEADVPLTSIIANNDEADVCFAEPVSVYVLDNDEELSESSLYIIGYTQGTRGTVTVDGSTLVYTPSAVFYGTDTFTYTVSTASCGVATTAVVTINSNPFLAPVLALDGATDGSGDYVEVVSSTATQFDGSFTAEAWIHWDGSRTEDYKVFVSKPGAPAVSKFAFVVYGRYLYGNIVASDGIRSIQASVPMPVDTWVHVAYTYSGDSAHLYMNGEPVVSVGYGTTAYAQTSADPVLIGREFAPGFLNDRTFPGQIADLRLWSVARTQQQIADNMIARLQGDESGLSAYFQFDDVHNGDTVGNSVVGEPSGVLLQGAERRNALFIVGADTAYSGGEPFTYATLPVAGMSYYWSAVNGSVVSSTGATAQIVWNDGVHAGSVVLVAESAAGCTLSTTLNVRLFDGGRVRYVCGSGNDTTGTGSAGMPLASIQVGVNVARTGDTVLVCPGTYYENVVIARDITVGSLYLVQNDTTYIDSTVINGSWSGPVVTFRSPVSTSATLTGFVLTNGGSSEGGGIAIYEASPTLRTLRVIANGSDEGGGIYVYYGSPVLTDLLIAGNTAYLGGGLFLNGDSAIISNVDIVYNSADAAGGGMMLVDGSAALLSNSTVSHNTATYAGGGIYMENAMPQLSNVTVSSNSAEWDGGGLYLDVSTPVLSAVTITENSAGSGGGLYINGGGSIDVMPVAPGTTGTVMNNSVVRNNTAYNGGGLFISGGFSGRGLPDAPPTAAQDWPDEVSITNTEISHNTADNSGGGVYIEFAQPYLGNVTVSDNSAYSDGGGIYVVSYPFFFTPSQPSALPSALPSASGEIKIDSSVIVRNSSFAGNGGGVYAQSGMDGPRLPGPAVAGMEFPPLPPGSLRIEASRIDSNSAYGNGGGMASWGGALVAVLNSTVSANTAGGSGGGLYSSYALMAVGGSVLSYNTAGGSGGGLYSDTSLVLLLQDTALHNSAGLHGGGLCLMDVDLETVTGLEVTDNMAGSLGGGLYVRSDFFDGDSIAVLRNYAHSGGGGLSMQGSTTQTLMVEMSDLTVSDNSAGNRAGGVEFGYYTEASVSGATIHGNTSTDDGGGLRVNYHSSLTLTDAEISDNTAGNTGNGAGIDVGYYSTAALHNVEVTRNAAGGSGGGIAVDYHSELSAANTTISDNSAGEEGGGLYVHFNCEADLDTVSIRRNTATDGGGMYVYYHTHPTLDAVVLDSNTARDNGGALYLGYYSSPVLSNVTVSGNTAADNGGGLYMYGWCEPALSATTFAQNSAGSSGGALYVGYSCGLALASSDILGNSAASGGGLAVNNGSAMLDSVHVHTNTASQHGGGLHVSEAVLTVVHSTVSGNSAGGNGGGLYADNADGVEVRTSSVHNNTAGAHGGGLHAYYTTPVLRAVTISGNSAGGNGGGIYQYSYGSWSAKMPTNEAPGQSYSMENVVISGNYAGGSAPCAGGGGLFLDNMDDELPLVALYTTVTGNAAPNGDGGGLLLRQSTLEMVNSIVWNNMAGESSDVGRCSSAVINAYHSVVHPDDFDSTWAAVECDPLFATPVNPALAPTTSGNVRLLDHSSAIGAGIEEIELPLVMVSASSTDRDGSPRGTLPDIGAYENSRDIPVRTLAAADDTLNVCIGTPAFADVLGNDSDEAGEMVILSYTQTTGGTIQLVQQPSTGFVYTPNQGFVGSDTFTYVVSTNACARPDTAVVMVHVGRYPAPVISGTTSVCSLSEHTYTAADGNGVGTSYQWTIDAPGALTPPVIVGSSTAATVVVNFGQFPAQTLCTLSVHITSQYGCSSTASYSIDGYSQPVASAGSDLAVCSGTTVALGTVHSETPATATGGSGYYSYAWLPADGLSDPASANPAVSVVDTMTYVVTVTDQITGCSAVDTVTVLPYTLPALVVSTTTGCGNQVTTYTITDTNNTGAAFAFNPESQPCGTVIDYSENTISILWSSVSETTVCMLSVSATTPQECTEAFTFPITIHPSPILHMAGASSVCSGSTQSYSITDSNETGASYSWNVAGGAIVVNEGSMISVEWSTTSEGTTGEVSVTATTSDGCTVTLPMTIQINTNPVIAVTGADSVFASSVYEYSAVTGTPGLAYVWSADGGAIEGASTGASVSVRWSTGNSVMVAGSITLTATNGDGCSTTFSLPVDIYPFIPVDIEGDDLTVGDTTGVYSVAGVDTTGASLEWSVSTGGTIVGSSTTGTIVVEWDDVEEPTTGTLTVVVTTPNGGTGSTTFTVTIYPRPILTVTGSRAVCSGSVEQYSVSDSRNTGSTFGWMVSGGTVIGPSTGSTITVHWNNTQVGTTASLLVIGYEPHGFDGTTTALVVVYPNPSFQIAGNSEVCGTTMAVYTAADANNTGVTTLTWTLKGGTIIAGQGSTSVTVQWDNVAATTTQTITVAGAGAHACASSMSMDVTVYATPVLAVSGAGAVCADSIAAYTVSDANATGAAYVWSVDGGTILTGQSTASVTVHWTTAGARSVTATATTPQFCSTVAVLPVTVYATPQPVITGMFEVCADSTTTLDAGAGYASYLWSNGAQTRTIDVATGGMYSVVVTNESGCSASTSATVTFLPPVMAQAGSDVEICSGASVRLAGAGISYVGDIEFRWTPTTGLSDPTIADPIASPNVTTTYTLIVTDGYGCSSSDQVTVTVKPLPVVQVSGDATICLGGSTQLAATGGVHYAWTPATGLSDPTIANPVASPSATTTYMVTVTNAEGCSVQHSLTVTVQSTPFADAGNDVTMCAGTSVQLAATGGVHYAWTPTTGLSDPTIANPVASPSATTTYTVTVTAPGGCQSTDQVTVTVQPLAVDVTALLEGPYTGSGMAALLQVQNLLPAQQPYNTAPFNYSGSETLGAVAEGTIVDWVLVELRSQSAASSVVARRAALLRTDGKIVDTDGVSPVALPTVSSTGSMYIVVRHRNHLAVMSSAPVSPVNCLLSYNFTGSQFTAYTQFMDALRALGAGSTAPFGLPTGDINADGIVNAADRVQVNNTTGSTGYLPPDISLDGIVNAVDRARVRNNTFYVTQVP